jgi:Prenyltransferase and squalene oxidase repeat
MRPVPPAGRHRALIRLGFAAGAAVLGAGVTLAVPASSQADALGACSATQGAVVAVDFAHWGGPVVLGCDAHPTTGLNLLHDGGFTTVGTVHDGPGFVCRIGSAGFDGRTQYPTPDEDPCTSTPPATAYWSYWIAPPGQDTWSYSPLGALSDVPVDGEVEAWTFGATDVGGTTGQPDFTPDSVRPGGGASPSAPQSPTTSPTVSATGSAPPPAQADLAAATAYLDAQLTAGDFVSSDGLGDPDYNLTAELGIALAATGGDDTALARIVSYLAANIDDAVYPNGASAPPDPTAVGNIALLTEVTGGDPRDVGGRDLIAALTGNVCAAAGSGGECTGPGDFYGALSPFAQATGILVLARAGVAVPQAAVTRLTGMQCSDGGFPGSMISPGDFCDPENDMTGLAVQALTALGGQTGVLAAAKSALLAAQQADGGFLPYTGATDSDTQTSALDAQALSLLGEDGAAQQALAFADSRQEPDGGFAADITTDDSDIYTTLTAVPAAADATLVTLSRPLAGSTPTQSPTTTPPTPVVMPNLAEGSAYLVSPANLIDGHYYSPFGGGFADWGMTVDGAFALAATGDQNSTLKGMVDYIDAQGADGSGGTVNDWTGVGTPYASGGALGKEALLAEVVGMDPHDFGGWDLIAQLDASVCAAASTGSDTSCAAAGNYTYSSSVFDQALGIMAQIRAGDTANAQAPIAYLESLQHADGSFPSLIPPTGDSDVDSTAMAAMALALVPGEQGAVAEAVSWIAGQQEQDGGFPGSSGDSVNSAALAIQGLTLESSSHGAQIDAAEGFLAGQQNSDGGFNVAAGGQPGSDVRASTQAVGGAVGTSFGTLSIDLSGVTAPPTTPGSPTPSTTPTVTHSPTPTHTPTPTRTPTRNPTQNPTKSSPPTTAPPASSYPAPVNTVSPSAPGFAATPSAGSTLGLAPSSASSPAAVAAPAPSAEAVATGQGTSINPLWWMTIGVAAVVATAVSALFVRRRRLAAAPPKADS